MDVALVLTHRCNLACSYCFAGEHHGRAMDRAVIDRAVDLLWADDPEVAQLSFFGGEPMLAFEAMQYAIARARAAAGGRRLLLQVTSNGTLIGPDEAAALVDAEVAVTVSVDGVREAHDRQRPRAGGQSSFDAVTRGLRALVDAGGAPDALMVVTPDSTPELEASVAWLWSEGIELVRANCELGATWSLDDRDDLRAALIQVGAELVRLRRAGHRVDFEPFGLSRERCATDRPRVVVATTGHLYPCTPMVGEDRDGGREARLRLGHVSEAPDAIVRRVVAEGLHCSSKGKCACAAYLETGDTGRLGPNGAFWGRLCQEVGDFVAAELADEAPAQAVVAVAAAVGAAMPLVPPARATRKRRSLLGGVMMGAGALGFVSASLPGLLRMVQHKRACRADASAAEHACGGADDDTATDESFDVAAAEGSSDATGMPQRSVLDRVAFQQALAAKTAEPHPVPKAGPPRPPARRDFRIMGKMPAHRFNVPTKDVL